MKPAEPELVKYPGEGTSESTCSLARMWYSRPGNTWFYDRGQQSVTRLYLAATVNGQKRLRVASTFESSSPEAPKVLRQQSDRVPRRLFLLGLQMLNTKANFHVHGHLISLDSC
jgi:hypothetical protein